MEHFSKLFVRVCLDTKSLANRKHLEEERELAPVSLTYFSGHHSLVVLDDVEQRPLGFDIFGRKRGMGSHP